MGTTIKKEDGLKLKFSGGLNSRASEEDVHPEECSDGFNFELDVRDHQFRSRQPFDLIGTLPNGEEVKGAATLLKSDGSVSTLIQGGGDVYKWTGGSNFSFVGSVNVGAKLRGRFEHIWQLDDKVIITDLNLIETVKQWDGTTFSSVNFTDETEAAFGNFKAKYCYVDKERAVFANVESNGTPTPHLIVGSKGSQFEEITVNQKPASALAEDDPFFLIQPDFQKINGLVRGINETVTSSNLGSMFKITGSSAKDFAMESFLTRTNAAGDEPVAIALNDIVFGRQGAIESARATEASGNIETNDLSLPIGKEIEEFNDWVVATNERLQITYFYPVNSSRVYVYYHSIEERNRRLDPTQFESNRVSPWSKFITEHPMAFNPTLMMNVYDPTDSLEYVIMGDSIGNVYRMEGTGENGDGGTTAIEASRTSKLFSSTLEGEIHDIEGYIRYRRSLPVTTTLTFNYFGEHIYNKDANLTVPQGDFGAVYGTGTPTSYYGPTQGKGGAYYGIADKVLARQRWKIAGRSNDFTIKISATDVDSFTINEIGVRFEETST